MQTLALAATELDALDDGTLVERARNRDGAAVRLIMQRHNRRLFRVARSVLNDDAEAEDVVQEAYVRAFTHLDGFRGEAQLSTWLTRIALNDALGRLRRRRTMVGLKDIDAIDDQGEARVIYLPSARQDSDPEAAAARAQVRRLLERAVDELPDSFRMVFVLRDIEEMSTEETASLHVVTGWDHQIRRPLNLAAEPIKNGSGGLDNSIVTIRLHAHTVERAEPVAAVCEASDHVPGLA
jgi:RNA polymerase sigma-70 factor, ECF subfamily